MAATSVLTMKLDPKEKAEFMQNAEAIGMNASTALKVMIRKFNECQGFPFEVRRPYKINPHADIPVAEMRNGVPVMPKSWVEDDDDDDEW